MATHPLNACPLVRCTRHARRLRITSMCNVRMLLGYGWEGHVLRHAGAVMDRSTLNRLQRYKRWQMDETGGACHCGMAESGSSSAGRWVQAFTADALGMKLGHIERLVCL